MDNYLNFGSIPPRYSRTRWRAMFTLLLTAGRFHLRYAQVQAQEEEKMSVLLVPICVVGVTTVRLC